MTNGCRVGRRLPLPSTVQILHELLAFSADENARQPLPLDAPDVSKPAPPIIDASAALAK